MPLSACKRPWPFEPSVDGIGCCLRRGDESAGVQTVARTLLAESRKYQQQAMLTGQDMGLQLTEDGYRLVHYQDGRWQAADGDPKPVSSDIRITFKAGELCRGQFRDKAQKERVNG